MTGGLQDTPEATVIVRISACRRLRVRAWPDPLAGVLVPAVGSVATVDVRSASCVGWRDATRRSLGWGCRVRPLGCVGFECAG